MQHEKKERKLARKDTWPVGFSPRKELPDALVFKGVFPEIHMLGVVWLLRWTQWPWSGSPERLSSSSAQSWAGETLCGQSLVLLGRRSIRQGRLPPPGQVTACPHLSSLSLRSGNWWARLHPRPGLFPFPPRAARRGYQPHLLPPSSCHRFQRCSGHRPSPHANFGETAPIPPFSIW